MPKEKKTNTSKIILGLIIAAVAALLIVFFLNINQRAEKKAAITIDQERQNWQNKISALEEKLENGDDQNPAIASDNASQTANSSTTFKQAATEAVATDSCQVMADQLDLFFRHLDSQDYFAELQQEGGAKTFFTKMATKLVKHQPKITRETDSLLTILQNTAHFYRTVGGENIFILKKIMAHEKAILEPTMAEFYTLITTEKECLHINYPIKLPLESIYNYSIFFLNTLGGQSYLFRRDLTLRTLTKYYCILILDQANIKGINNVGADIRSPLTNLISEMDSLSGLRDKEKYIDTLLQLQEKYDRQYGD